MSLPRQVVPGRAYMITRRCTQRQFLMRPDPETNEAFIYCLAVAANRCDVGVFFFIAMSNHHHVGVIDRSGRLPEFMAYFHKLFAKHGNALRHRRENFWASEHASVVEVVDPEDAMAKTVYALTNPVKDHLVEKAHHWPGASSLRATFHGHKIIARRPRRFFSESGPLPEVTELQLSQVPGFQDEERPTLIESLAIQIAEKEQRACTERLSQRRSVVGRKRVLRQDWRSGPESEPSSSVLDPRMACRNFWRRIETLTRNRLFLDAYRRARESFLLGHETIFPPGTYWLSRHAGVPVALPAP